MKALKYISLVVLFFAACSPQKRMTRLAVAHPSDAAIVLDKLFPIKQSVTVIRDTTRDTVQLPGTIVKVNCDSLQHAKTITGDTTKTVVLVPCPPAKLIYEKIYVDSIVEKENTKVIDALRIEKEALREKLIKKTQTNKYLWIAIAALAVIVVARLVVRMFF